MQACAGHSCFRSLPLSVPHVCRVTRIDFPVVVHPDEPEPGNKQADSRLTSNLQINLLAEQESTKMLQISRNYANITTSRWLAIRKSTA
jgi:hypothetical protein